VGRLLKAISICVVSIAPVMLAYAQSQPPPTIVANDPDFTAFIGDQMNWPEAWYFQQQKEITEGPNYEEVDVVVLDDGIDSTQPDLAGQCRTDLFVNLAGDGVSATDPYVGIHGTAMAGNICALVNNGLFVASAAGLIPGRVKLISVRWTDGSTIGSPETVRAGLQYVLNLVAAGINVRLVNWSAGETDDDPAATQALLTSLRDNGVVVLTPAGSSMLGTYANQPQFSVVSQMELDPTGEAPELHSNGIPFGNLAVPGGVINNIIPIHSADGGSGSGLETGEAGVSDSTAFASGCLAALIQYGPEKDPLRALRRLELTGTMFPALVGHSDFGRIDLYAAMTASVSLPPAPNITTVTYNGAKKVIVRGQNFGKNPGVIINGVDVSALITSSTTRVIKIKGSPGALGVKPGNINTVTVNGGVGQGSSQPIETKF
jgi:hypothetical protein